MLKRIHKDCFELKSRKKVPFLEFPAPKSKRIIVQHPYMYFDPLGGLDFLPHLIYNKTVQLDYKGDIKFVNIFQDLSEQKACLKEDYILWWWTGYWTVLKNKKYFIGSGLESLKNAIGDFEHGKASYCLTNRDSIILINFEFNKGLIEKGVVFDFFINNAYLPYIETINPFLTTIAEIGKFNHISEKKIKISDICKTRLSYEEFNFPLGGLDRSLKANIQQRDFILNPVAYVQDEDDDNVILVVIKNEFSTNWNSINSVKYLVGNCAGGFTEADFTGDKKFNINGEILFLNNNIIINTYLIKTGELESIEETLEVISDNNLQKQLEDGKKDKIKVRDFEDLAKELGI